MTRQGDQPRSRPIHTLQATDTIRYEQEPPTRDTIDDGSSHEQEKQHWHRLTDKDQTVRRG